MSARGLKEVKGGVMLEIEMFCESHEINVRENVMLMMWHGVRKLHRLRKMRWSWWERRVSNAIKGRSDFREHFPWGLFIKCWWPMKSGARWEWWECCKRNQDESDAHDPAGWEWWEWCKGREGESRICRNSRPPVGKALHGNLYYRERGREERGCKNSKLLWLLIASVWIDMHSWALFRWSQCSYLCHLASIIDFPVSSSCKKELDLELCVEREGRRQHVWNADTDDT